MKIFNLSQTPKAVIEASQAEGFSIRCMETSESVELMIMDEIGKNPWGEGIGASDVVSFLGSNRGKPVNVRINSFGGSFYEGLVMHNAFLEHDAEITATIQGIAFSAATLPAMGASKLVMSAQADFGIHRAWTVAGGNQRQMMAVVEWLEKVDNHLAEIYQAKTGATSDQMNQWLDGTDDGTIFSSSEALAVGFADEVIEAKKPTNDKSKAAQALAAMHRQKIKSRIRSLTS